MIMCGCHRLTYHISHGLEVEENSDLPKAGHCFLWKENGMLEPRMDELEEWCGEGEFLLGVLVQVIEDLGAQE
jgi:hypothetical protein